MEYKIYLDGKLHSRFEDSVLGFEKAANAFINLKRTHKNDGKRVTLYGVSGEIIKRHNEMKKLQSNFTTVEQSKRLLELGVPADSADCYHNRIAGKPMPISMENFLFSDPHLQLDKVTLPCWSVGRLIEIIKICLSQKDFEIGMEELMYCKDFVRACIGIIELNMHVIDFSKLEE